MTVITGLNGYTWTQYPQFKDPVVAHVVQSVDGGLHMDQHDDHSHLVLSGNLASNEKFIECKQNGVEIFSVDNDGDIACKNVVSTVAGSLSTLKTEHDAVKAVVDAASSTVTASNTLVMRGGASGTEMQNILCNQIAAIAPSPSMAIYGDGNYS